MTKKKKSPPRPKGGQKGNKNALKHGLYADVPDSKDVLTLEQRRGMFDHGLIRLYAKLDGLKDLDEFVKWSNAMLALVTGANNCDRTIALVTGKYTPLDEAMDALKILDFAEN